MDLVVQIDHFAAAGNDAFLMGDVDDACADMAGVCLQVAENHGFCGQIHVGGTLIKDEHAGVTQERPGKGQALTLAAGETGTALSDPVPENIGVVKAITGADLSAQHIHQTGLLKSFDHLRLCDPALQAVQEVVHDRARKEVGFLGGVEQTVCQFLLAEGVKISAEEGDPAVDAGEVPGQRAHQRGLAAAVLTPERHRRTARNVQVCVICEGAAFFGIGDHDILQGDAAAGDPLAGCRDVKHGVSGRIGDLQQGFGLDQGGRGLIHESVDFIDGLDQLLEQQGHGDNIARTHAALGDQNDGQQDHQNLECNLACLLAAVIKSHILMVCLLGPADQQDIGAQAGLLVAAGIQAADQLQIQDRLADQAVQCVLLADDPFPDTVLGAYLENRNQNAADQVHRYYHGDQSRCLHCHLEQGTQGDQGGGEDVVAADLQQVAEACHSLVQLRSSLCA